MSTIRAPASPTLANELWTLGEILVRLPSLFGVANAEPESSTRPQSERVISQAMMGVIAVTAVVSAPFVFATVTIVHAGERLWRKIDVLPEIVEKVQVFGEALNEQEKLIEKFRPLLDLHTKVAVITRQAEKKATDCEADTRRLEQLRKDYATEIPLLEQLDVIITRLQTSLAQEVSAVRPGSLKETMFKERVEVLQAISEEEQKLRALTERLKGLMSRVRDKDAQLQKLEKDMTILTRIKETQIERIDLNLIPPPPPKEVTYGPLEQLA